MEKKLETVPVLTRTGKIRHYRKDTNEEIMLKSIQKRGFIRIILVLRLHHPETGSYSGWQKSSLTIDAKDIPSAQMFYRKLREAVYKITKETPKVLEMPDAIVVKE